MTSLQLGIDLDNPEFQDIWKLISYTSQSVFMTGKAGSGKSTFLRYIVENTRKKTVVLAPTGIAAVNAGGVTLHSFFHIPFKPLLPDDPELTVRNLRQRLRHTAEQQKLIRELELVIIDEVSMVRADIIDFVDKVLRVYSGRIREPFGGKQLLLVGDLFQLEPVVTQDMRDIFRDIYPNLYFFSARVFREFALIPIELRKVYRQSDAAFVAMLDRMRLGTPSADDMRILDSRVVTEDIDEDLKNSNHHSDRELVVTLAPKRNTVDSINQSHLDAIKRKLYTFEGDIRDKFPENSLPAPKELQIKVGAQVVFVRNDPERRWVNGTVGKIHSVSKNNLEVQLEDGKIHSICREIWENVSYKYNDQTKKIEEEVLGTFTQYPLRLAWALTIHKSQGLTFSNVIIDMEGGAFAAGQAYVALSRCRSLAGLKLRCRMRPYDFFVNAALRGFSGMFNNPQLMAAAMRTAHADDSFNKAAKAFEARNFSDAVDYFTDGLYARDELSNPLVNRLLKQKLYNLGAMSEKINSLENEIVTYREKFDQLAKEYISMGTDCLQDENFGAAIANYNKAISLCPDCREALLLRGEAALDCMDYELAAESFGRIIEMCPNDFDSLFAIGRLHQLLAKEAETEDVKMEEYYKAVNYYMAAESSKSDSAPLHDRMAQTYDEIGDTEEADKHRILARRLRKRKH